MEVDLAGHGIIYDTKDFKFGRFQYVDCDNDRYYILNWENDAYFNELINPWDFDFEISIGRLIFVEDNSEQTRLFLRLKYER